MLIILEITEVVFPNWNSVILHPTKLQLTSWLLRIFILSKLQRVQTNVYSVGVITPTLSEQNGDGRWMTQR